MRAQARCATGVECLYEVVWSPFDMFALGAWRMRAQDRRANGFEGLCELVWSPFDHVRVGFGKTWGWVSGTLLASAT